MLWTEHFLKNKSLPCRLTLKSLQCMCCCCDRIWYATSVIIVTILRMMGPPFVQKHLIIVYGALVFDNGGRVFVKRGIRYTTLKQSPSIDAHAVKLWKNLIPLQKAYHNRTSNCSYRSRTSLNKVFLCVGKRLCTYQCSQMEPFWNRAMQHF